jgi:hypothetical protein
MLLDREWRIASQRGLDRRLSDASATRDFHACDRQSARLRLLHNRYEFLSIMREFIQLRATDDDRSTAQIPRVKVRHGERDTIGTNEKVGTLKKGCLRRHEHKLHRPLLKRRRRWLIQCTRHPGRRLKRVHRRSRTAVHRHDSRGYRKRGGSPGSHNSRLVKFLSVSFHDSQSTLWALADTSTKTVAEGILYELGLASDQRKRALVACCNALAAAVAFLLVNLNNFPLHERSPAASLPMTGFDHLVRVTEAPLRAATALIPLHAYPPRVGIKVVRSVFDDFSQFT